MPGRSSTRPPASPGAWHHPGLEQPPGALGRRLRAWLRPPRTLHFTREGKYFVAICMGLGFAAINTGNNLLYLLFGMMLSLIVASGVLSEMSLRGLEVERRPPSRVHADQPFLMGLVLRNRKRRLPSFSVEVEDLLEGHESAKRCYFLKLPAGRTQETSYRHQLPRRGRVRYTGFRLSTKFPFALFRKSRLVEAPGEVVVLPALHPVAPPLLPPRTRLGDEERARRGRVGEFHGLRDYRQGDDPRDIHWRSSARRGRPVVREHEEEARRRLTLVVDNGVPGGAHGPAELLEDLERSIRRAASLARHYVGEGCAVRIRARGASSRWATTPARLHELYVFLALLPASDTDVPFPPGGIDGGEVLAVAPRGVPSARPARARQPA